MNNTTKENICLLTENFKRIFLAYRNPQTSFEEHPPIKMIIVPEDNLVYYPIDVAHAVSEEQMELILCLTDNIGYSFKSIFSLAERCNVSREAIKVRKCRLGCHIIESARRRGYRLCEKCENIHVIPFGE